MKNTKPLFLILCIILLTIISCKNDDESTPIIPPDYTSEFVGLWKFDNPENYADAIFFGSDGEAYQVFYGDLNTIHLVIADFYTYEFENNQVTYLKFGNNAISYEGGNTFTIPGNSMTRVSGINELSDLIETLSFNEEINVDVTTFLSGDLYNNLDGFGEHLLVPNPSAAAGRYIRFQKSNLNFVEEVTGIGQSTTSIGVYDTNPFELLSVLEENNKFRIYQPSNPAFHPPTVDDIPFTPNRYRCHTVTNESGRDFISYNRNTKSFNYHDVNILNEQQGVSEFAFYEVPPSHLRIRAMDYVENNNKLIITDTYNLHVFNIGFNSDSDGVSVFEHERSISIIPLILSNEEPYFGRIQGLYYDADTQKLYLIIKNNGVYKLIKTNFQL